MKIKPKTTPRLYRQGARAEAAEQTAERIIDAFARRIREDWYDQITLEQLAQEAQVTVPTIIRRFGGKEALLKATWDRVSVLAMNSRPPSPGDVSKGLHNLSLTYERIGDMVVRALAQEERFEAFKDRNDMGRQHHRGWVESTFAPWLDGLAAGPRRRRVDALVTATDVYVWKLVRRDMGRSQSYYKSLVLELVTGLIGDTAIESGNSTGASP